MSVAEDVFVKVGKFHFPADFVVVGDPLILRRSFLKTKRALIDVYAGELTLRVNNKAVAFNLDQTSRYSASYNDMTVNRVDVIDMACEEYLQKVLSFSDVITSGNPTPYYDPIVSNSSLTLTPFGDRMYLPQIQKEIKIYEANNDKSSMDEPPEVELKDLPPHLEYEVDHSYYDTEGDILPLKAFLNDDPSLPPPNQGMYLPQIQKEIKICEANNDKSSMDEPPEVELKDLPPHLEYVFLEGDDKLPFVIAKDLTVEEKAVLIKVLKSRKQAIALKLSDIKVIDPEVCTHKILMEYDFEPAVQYQRRVNPKIYEVIKKEVLKLLDARLIYLISNSPWEGICINYGKLNEATRKDHFPLPVMDQMLERLAGNEYYCFLDGFLGLELPVPSLVIAVRTSAMTSSQRSFLSTVSLIVLLSCISLKQVESGSLQSSFKKNPGKDSGREPCLFIE
uniref:Reverse transcriptase domain-containing protein n=1 Tax=Tanacetum cinerariifolium TaxID=118510 RepID=A0A6L2LQX5_TANCI|nr:reverse transcriptase domain-containing protein [Tanacetum cinerariifolium]